MADYHKLIRGCDVLCLLDCGQWTVPVYALQIQNGLFHWKDEHEGLSYDIFYCLEKVAFICRDGLYSGESVLYSIHSNIGSLVGIMLLLFGTIACAGIANLINNCIDMSRTRNIIIVSLTLTVGIGGAVFTWGEFSLSGIGLAALVGVLLNQILPHDN